jgi:hypothetical protein
MNQNSNGHLNITHFKEKVQCRTSSYKTSIRKDDVKVKVPNGTLKSLIPSNGVVNWDGVFKFGGRPKGDHVMDLWS